MKYAFCQRMLKSTPKIEMALKKFRIVSNGQKSTQELAIKAHNG